MNGVYANTDERTHSTTLARMVAPVPEPQLPPLAPNWVYGPTPELAAYAASLVLSSARR